MGAVGIVFGAELRNRWRQWTAMAFLVVIVGGFALAAASAGYRTERAFSQFVAAKGFDAAVYAYRPVPQLATLPEVRSSAEFVSPFGGPPSCACTHPITASDLSTGVLVGNANSFVKLVAGRRPNPSKPDEVLASFNLIQDAGVRLGTIIRIHFYAAAQLQSIASATGVPPAPVGPAVALHVVGFEASEQEFPSGASPSYDLLATSSFLRTVIPKTAAASVYLVRLRNGSADIPRFSAEVNRLSSLGVEGFLNEDVGAASVEASIHPQALGWWILALLSGAIGLAVVGQALARQSLLKRVSYPPLCALGMKSRQLVALGMTRNLGIALFGACGAACLAVALSPIAPLGEARVAENSTGIEANLPVLFVGTISVVAAVLVLGIIPSVHAARSSRQAIPPLIPHPSAIASRLALLGAPASMLIGVRHALQRRSGSSTVPVGTALLGTVLAVTALCGTGIFGASLTHLTRTPALYGDSFQLNFTDPSPSLNPDLLRALEHNPGVASITHGITTETLINGVAVGGIATTSIRGPVLLSTVTGHLPSSDREIGLGAATMRQVHAHIGSIVSVTVPLPSGSRRTLLFKVVDQISFPVLGGAVGLGIGAAFSLSGYEAAICPPTLHPAACKAAAAQTGGGGLLVRVVDGPRGQAAIAQLLNSYRSIAALPITPTSLINFGEAVNFPLIFGILLAIFGAATLVHMLIESVARRRNEIGILEVLGFVRRQVVSCVAWQATTLALVGVAFGVPLGIVAGKASWTAFSSSLGAVPATVVPVMLVIAIAGGELVLANLLAVVPGVVAGSVRPSRLLRTQ